MIVSFLSFNENIKTAFQAEADQRKNTISFEDKSCPNTEIRISWFETSILLERFGQVEMNMLFSLEQPTKGFYKNQEGVEFEYTIHTDSLFISKNRIKVSYTLYLENQEITKTTFQVSLFQKNTK
ncbi:DUF1934 domain-containing protein [bacterium]|nr:DUF1934 domain-containing protein [bacterium]